MQEGAVLFPRRIQIVKQPRQLSFVKPGRGTRITVWDILGWLGGGLTKSKILSDYLELASEDIQAALQFAY